MKYIQYAVKVTTSDFLNIAAGEDGNKSYGSTVDFYRPKPNFQL
jgi:hypothetical protein